MTVKVTKPSVNIREELASLKKPSGIVGESILRADTAAEAVEQLNLEDHTFTTFTSTGIDDNATSTAMTLDSSGHLLVGTTDTLAYNAGARISQQSLVVTNTSATATDYIGYFNRQSSDGTILQFGKANGNVGSIGTTGGDLIIGTGDTGLYFYDGATSVIPWKISTNAASNGYSDLGHPAYRWKDLYLSGGVYLGGTGPANKLDDYEEGTWTPTVVASTGTITTVGTVSGFYTKVGRLVTIHFSVAITNNGTGSGFIIVSGIPFVPSASAVYAGSGVQNTTANSLSITTINASSQTYIRLYNGTYPASSGETLRGSVTYMTA